MATLASDLKVEARKRRWRLFARIGGFALVVAITVAILLWGKEVPNLPIYGYPAVFLISLLGNATLVFPAPSYLVVGAAGSNLDPLTVGIVAGLGAALGELTGYLAGASGKSSVEEKKHYLWVERHMKKSGHIVIFLLGAIPNFFFDIGGLLAGVTRMPIWQFILLAWAGKSIRMTVIALVGNYLAAG
jgi:membrane protein YqaA with SNARE-associated domain